jgi:hypothetical protein
LALTWAPKHPRVAGPLWRTGAWFALLGALPDADLLLGAHRAISHSLGAAVIVGLAAAALTREGRVALAAALAYGSHALLDWLSEDTSVPLGVMGLWPLTTDYYLSSTAVFDSIWRKKETPDFWEHNLKAIGRELLILGPLLGIVLWVEKARRSGRGQYV